MPILGDSRRHSLLFAASESRGPAARTRALRLRIGGIAWGTKWCWMTTYGPFVKVLVKSRVDKTGKYTLGFRNAIIGIALLRCRSVVQQYSARTTDYLDLRLRSGPTGNARESTGEIPGNLSQSWNRNEVAEV